MAKGGRPRHLQARVAFLDQAAKLLASAQFQPIQSAKGEAQEPQKGLPIWLASHMRIVAKRSQIRVDQDVKRATCKICATPLLEGHTLVTKLQNESNGGKKPWADVRVTTCTNCGASKRFPIGATRQTKKRNRVKVQKPTDAVALDPAPDMG